MRNGVLMERQVSRPCQYVTISCLNVKVCLYFPPRWHEDLQLKTWRNNLKINEDFYIVVV